MCLKKPRGPLGLLLVTLALGATWASASPALAAPQWGLAMTHANPYGQQASACPGGKPQTEPEPCGIDPFTELKEQEGFGGEGKTFARESGANTYTITVTNTAASKEGNVTVV